MDAFDLANTQVGFYVIVVSLLVLAYQVHQLREAKKPRLERKVLDQLLEGEPIKVKHNTPRSLTPDGKECCGAEKDDLLSLVLVLRRLDKQFLQPSRSTNPLQELRDTSIRGGRCRCWVRHAAPSGNSRLRLERYRQCVREFLRQRPEGKGGRNVQDDHVGD